MRVAGRVSRIAAARLLRPLLLVLLVELLFFFVELLFPFRARLQNGHLQFGL